MAAALEPAVPAFDEAGTPFSALYGDIYHSAESGPGQARHVFLGGNGLPSRWAGRRLFVVLETGFGIGLNFLATWQCWREDARRPQRLHFVSVERHPFSSQGLEALHRRWPEFAVLSRQLRERWPLPLPGLHRLNFENGALTLSLVFADAGEALQRLRLRADAIYLDGFDPERNPDMWSPRVFKALARLAGEDTSFATYSAARRVRDALEASGFAAERAPGFGRKRDMLRGRYAPRRLPRGAPPASPASWPERRAAVIGAGLAGAAACERLAARGWEVRLLETGSGPAAGASGLHAAAFHPHVSADDSLLSRLTRAGFLYAAGVWRELPGAGEGVAWKACGLLQMARDDAQEAHMAETIARLGWPDAYVRQLGRAAAVATLGCEPRRGGWWFPSGGWVRPGAAVAAQLGAAAGASARFRARVESLAFEGDRWQVRGGGGEVLASVPVVVLANAGDAVRLAPVGQALGRSRGQLTLVPACGAPDLRVALTGAGLVLPCIGGAMAAGSSFAFDDDDPLPQSHADEANLARMAWMLPAFRPASVSGATRAEVGFRCVAPDRMPFVGALPDLRDVRGRARALAGAHLPGLPRLPGLFGTFAHGSRGLIGSALAGELIACLIEGEPPPVESDLADALDPARFVLRKLRRGAAV